MAGASSLKAPPRDVAGWLLDLDLEPLEGFFSRTMPGFRAPMSLQPARPGSTATFIIATPDQRYVLRRAPDHSGAPALEREFRILAALSQRNFPSPRPIIYCDNEKLIGSAFFVMEHIEGRAYHDPVMTGANPAFRAKAYDSLNAVLVQLHNLDPRLLGTSVLGNGRNYVAEQVEVCTARYRSAGVEVADIDRLIAWLPKHLPPDRPPRLVHGDFRIDNILFHPDEPRVIGVLNWRFANLGDPIADAVYHFMAWILLGSTRGGLTDADLADLGIPALEVYAATYAHRAGLKTIPHFETYFAYNLFRMAVLEGIPANGAAPRLGTHLRPLAALAWAFARRAGAA